MQKKITFERFSGLLFLFYCIIFYQIAAILDGNLLVALSSAAFTLTASLVFFANITPLHRHVQSAISQIQRTGEYSRTFLLLLLISFLPFAVMYILHGVPIISGKTEESRMILINNYGLLYRLSLQACFFLPSIVILGISKGWISRFLGGSVIFCVFLLIYSMGFRGRVMDYIAISLVSHIAVASGRFRFSQKYILVSSVLVFCGACLVVLLTKIRIESTFYEALYVTFDRIFLLNYDINFGRIFSYSSAEGYIWGVTYLTDFLSLIVPTIDSMQEHITRYFNKENSDLFIMTPTAYGEAFVNFGHLAFLLGPAVILAYRFLAENLFCKMISAKTYGSLFFCVYVNLIYFIPRTAATGGVANAYYIRAFGIFLLVILMLTLLSLGRSKSHG